MDTPTSTYCQLSIVVLQTLETILKKRTNDTMGIFSPIYLLPKYLGYSLCVRYMVGGSRSFILFKIKQISLKLLVLGSFHI